MKLLRESEMGKRNGLFDVLGGSSGCQIASMVLQPGESSGQYGNEHPGSDQVLYVVQGRAAALIEGQEIELGEDDIVLIEAGERHQIRCAGNVAVRTINIYSPPAY